MGIVLCIVFYFKDFDNVFVKSYEKPVVIKADGLAAGKGVIVCKNKDEANDAIDTILTKKSFGDAGSKIILEERYDGLEASYNALCDGKIGIPMATSQDHKRVFDNDEGPNTGGMGAYSPIPSVSEEFVKRIMDEAVHPTLQALIKRGIDYRGVLYAGIMNTAKGPKILEYNVRFGDPEAQVILNLLETSYNDLLTIMLACQHGLPMDIRWKSGYAANVVLSHLAYYSAL